MTLDERLELATKYYETFGISYKNPKIIIEECEKLKILGCEWGEIRFGEYGRIGDDFIFLKGGKLTNQTTNYDFDEEKYYIHWDNGNIGRLMFIDSADYSEEETEIWEGFKAELMSYNPLDYDSFNCHIVYDIENGKKVMSDYKNICKRTNEKFSKYLKKKRIKKAKEEYERLLEEEV